MFGSTYLREVTTLKLSAGKCTGCGMCTTVCPHHVFVVEEKKARIIDLDACMECGACAKNCAVGAIFVRSGVGCASMFIRKQKHGRVSAFFFRMWGYPV